MWLEAKTFDFSAQIVNPLRVNLVFDSLAVFDQEVLWLLMTTPRDLLAGIVDTRVECAALELLLVLLRLGTLNEHLLFELATHSSGIELLTVVQIVLLPPFRVDDIRANLTIKR